MKFKIRCEWSSISNKMRWYGYNQSGLFIAAENTRDDVIAVLKTFRNMPEPTEEEIEIPAKLDFPDPKDNPEAYEKEVHRGDNN